MDYQSASIDDLLLAYMGCGFRRTFFAAASLALFVAIVWAGWSLWLLLFPVFLSYRAVMNQRRAGLIAREIEWRRAEFHRIRSQL